MPTRTIDTETAKRFSAWLKKWVESHKYTQLQAAVLVGMTPSHFNQMLSGKSAASVFQMEKVATAINRDLADILVEGRQILAGQETLDKKLEDSGDILSDLSADSKKVMLKAKKILEAGGDDAKLLKQFIKRL